MSILNVKCRQSGEFAGLGQGNGGLWMSMTCRNCGLLLDAADAFCGNCGNAVTADRAVPEGPAGAARQWPPDPGDGRPPASEPDAPEARAPQPWRQAKAPADEPEIDDNPRVTLAYEQLGLDMTGDWSFDPLRNKRFLGQLARRLALYFLAAAAINFVIFIFQIVSFLSSSGLSSAGFGSAGSSFVGFLGTVSLLIWIASFLLFWLLPVPGLLWQWSRLLSHQAPAAQRAFEHISQALDRHMSPRDALRVRPYPLPGEGHRHFLELHRGVFAGFISCFPHGSDLYIGYSFWIRMSPFRMVLMRVGRTVQDWGGRGNDMYQTLRYESTRATLCAIHGCTLEGIEAAIGEPGQVGRPAVPAPAAPPAGERARQRVRGPEYPGR